MDESEGMQFRSVYLGPRQFLIVKERQGRGIDYMEVVKELEFSADHIAFAFGSPDYEYYRKNYNGYDIYCFPSF